MSKIFLNRVGLLWLPLVVAAVLVGGAVDAQEKSTAKAPPKSEKKAGGRLPSYYGGVVTKEQREKIYAVQAKYVDQIQKLREQIEALEMQQKDEVEAVLTPEQRDQVAKLISDAKSKRSKKTDTATEAASPR